MLVQKDMLAQLKWFGLNSYESRLWTALLAKGAATAGDLSDIADVPRSRTYDVLEALERKGFIIIKLGKPIKYLAVPPEAVLEKVKKRITEDAEEKTNSLNKLKETELLNELKMLHKTGIEMVEPFELSGSLRGRKNIYEHIESLIRAAQKTITIVTTDEGISRKKSVLGKALRKAKERGVKIRFNAPALSSDAKKAAAELKEFCDVKNSAVTARFCVVDSKQLVFILSDDKETNPSFDHAIWVTTPFLAGTFEKMIDFKT